MILHVLLSAKHIIKVIYMYLWTCNIFIKILSSSESLLGKDIYFLDSETPNLYLVKFSKIAAFKIIVYNCSHKI